MPLYLCLKEVPLIIIFMFCDLKEGEQWTREQAEGLVYVRNRIIENDKHGIWGSHMYNIIMKKVQKKIKEYYL
jgi:hypothetical protein